jgi:hypothetical protein
MLGKLAGTVVIAVYGAAAADVAVIVNSGSTNTSGFRIVVERSGKAESTTTPQGKQMRRKLPEALTKQLYSDLRAATPLSSLPAPRCMKSASFGTKLTIEFGGQETPDLSCGGGDNAMLQALIRDANEIVKLFDSN